VKLPRTLPLQPSRIEHDADRRPFAQESKSVSSLFPAGKSLERNSIDAQHLPPSDDYRHHRKYFAKENLPVFSLSPSTCGFPPRNLLYARTACPRPGSSQNRVLLVSLPGRQISRSSRANTKQAIFRSQAMSSLARRTISRLSKYQKNCHHSNLYGAFCSKCDASMRFCSDPGLPV